jgi:hypothetical protein
MLSDDVVDRRVDWGFSMEIEFSKVSGLDILGV